MYPLYVTYDAYGIVSPREHIGKGAHLRNLLGPNIHQFIGFAPCGDEKPDLPILRKGFANYTLWQQSSLPGILFSQKPDIFVAPFNTAPLFVPKQTKLILVLHDLIPFQNYRDIGLRFQLLLRYWRALIAASVPRAFLVITVSEYSRREILARFPKARVTVLPNTISESWYVRKSIIPPQERDNYVLMVSALSPHKNLQRALLAYAGYVRDIGPTAADLRIIGISEPNVSRLQPQVRELGICDRVQFMPYLCELELQDLYRRAKALFVPSLMEGFGIPVLEGMASGTPVISSSATSLPEVGGTAPEYCDPHDVGDMSRALKKVLGDITYRGSMIGCGLLRAEAFHRAVVAAQIDRFWKDLPEQLIMALTASGL
jgi:glycosyltransferase involved in cell wall biosynthesis